MTQLGVVKGFVSGNTCVVHNGRSFCDGWVGPSQIPIGTIAIGFSHWYNRYENNGLVTDKGIIFVVIDTHTRFWTYPNWVFPVV